jgi:hypothetical protein
MMMMTNEQIERAAAGQSLTGVANYLRAIGHPVTAGEIDRCVKVLTSQPAPSGWQQRIAAIVSEAQPLLVELESRAEAWLMRSSQDAGGECPPPLGWACSLCGGDVLYCKCHNAKDAIPTDPIASAVRAELQPLEDALIDAGHKLAKDGELRRKPFRLDVSKEWCERMAQLEEGHDVCAGGEPLPDAKDGDA